MLVDFWDCTCVDCIGTLPYMKEWYSRSKNYGLVIPSVHLPEFEFAKKRENVAEATLVSRPAIDPAGTGHDVGDTHRGAFKVYIYWDGKPVPKED